MFNNFHIEFQSFWLGFIAGILCIGILLRLRVVIPELFAWIKKQTQYLRRSWTKTTENRLREDTIRYTQNLHLAASLFSLDEIIIEPRLMYPILSVEVDSESVYQDITSEVIPNMPDWPELAGLYGAPTFTFAESLSGGANLVIIGQPGSGKSTALAHLACQLARRSSEVDAIKDRLPLFVHVLDLPLGKEFKELLDPLVNALDSYASPLTQTRLSELVQSALQNGHALLILDGLDEITKTEAESIIQWLENLLKQYPDLQVVADARADDLLGLNRLGFKPLAIAAWNENTRNQFYDCWAHLWSQKIIPLQPGTSTNNIDPLVLTYWLKTKNEHPTPFEVTLKAWALFSGDLRSNDLAGLIDCYLRRITANTPNGYRALERTAVHMILAEMTFLTTEEFRTQVREFETIITPPVKDDTEKAQGGDGSSYTAQLDQKTGKASGLVSSGSQLISLFVNHGLLVTHANSRIRFSHSIITTFLAGHAFASDGTITALIGQKGWYGKWQTLGYAGFYADISEVINTLLAKSQDDILASDLFQMARWLSITPKLLSWRANILRALATLVQQEYLTEGLVARAVCAIGLAGEPSVGILFRQWLKSDHSNMRRFGSLGCGLVNDGKAVQELALLIEDPDPKVGKAACLALVAIGNKAALDIVVSTLLQSNESMRRVAAEALVNHENEGNRILLEGTNDEDLLVRRSVVFGIMRSKQSELVDILKKLAVDDKQWVVRNAATNAIEILRLPDPYVPKPSVAVTEIPWLIDFAGKQGIGVQAGKPAEDLICTAIECGDENECLLALEHIRYSGGEYAIRQIYQVYIGNQEPIHQAAYDALYTISASGVKLPPLSQFRFQQ